MHAPTPEHDRDLPPQAGKDARRLVLGLGNDLLSDDAIGLRLAAALRERLAGQRNLTVLQTSEMGLALLDLVAGFDELILLDAIQTGQAAPGTLHEICGGELEALPIVSPHFLGIGETLALGCTLGLRVPTRLTIFAVEVQDPHTVATRMTPPLEAALPTLIDRIAARIPSGAGVVSG